MNRARISMAIPLVLILIAGFGIQIAHSRAAEGDALHELSKHIGYVCVSLCVGLLLGRVVKHSDSERLGWGLALLLATVAVLMAIAVIQAEGRWPSGRWIRYKWLSFQPAETLRFLLPLAVAWQLTKREERRACDHCLWAFFGVNVALVTVQGDLSLLCFVGLGIIGICWYLGEHRWLVYFTAGATGVVLLVGFAHAENFGLRILATKNGTLVTHQEIVRIAIDSAGVFEPFGSDSATSIPLATRDCAFARTVQLYGRIAGFAIICCCVAIVAAMRSWLPSLGTTDQILGVTWLIAFIAEYTSHIYSNLGLMPFVGVNLPFVSAGGTSMGLYLGCLLFLFSRSKRLDCATIGESGARCVGGLSIISFVASSVALVNLSIR